MIYLRNDGMALNLIIVALDFTVFKIINFMESFFLLQ